MIVAFYGIGNSVKSCCRSCAYFNCESHLVAAQFTHAHTSIHVHCTAKLNIKIDTKLVSDSAGRTDGYWPQMNAQKIVVCATHFIYSIYIYIYIDITIE